MGMNLIQKKSVDLLKGLQTVSSKAFALKLLQKMYLTRFVDEKMEKMVRQNKGATFHLGTKGHEMIGSIAGLSLQSKKDWALPYYRDRAFAVGFGCSLKDLFASFLARESENHSSARQMPEHFSQKDLRIPCQSSCVGSQFLQAVGVAKSAALRGQDEVVYVSGGDGSTSQGDFHEMLNFACIHRLPLVIVIQDNGWAISVSKQEQTAGLSIAKMAKGYEGLSVFEIDGSDFEQTSHAMNQAVAQARSGKGPSLVVAEIPRLSAHSSSDDPKKYMTDAQFSDLLARDPIPRFEAWLVEKGYISTDELIDYREKAKAEVEIAAAAADEMPFPDTQFAASNVFKEVDPIPSISSRGESVVIMDALNHALKEEMEKDPGVVVFGQDVADGKGGVFGITRGLSTQFGRERCFNTPLAESTIVALAMGLSFDGFHKPVAEIQFADYSWTGMNQLFNELATVHYRSNGQWNCPVVIRMPYGGYIQGGPYHSQSTEAFLAHCPGLKVVIPSNAADAKRLLKSAIRDPNPVVFLEHKALYRQRLFCSREEPGAEEYLPLGKAKVVREGADVTFIGWGMTVCMGAEVADLLDKEGISIEVIDLRTIVPLDWETVLRSVQKTGKVLIAHEAPRNCGFGAELAARMAQEAFHYLDAPIQRIGGENCPVPYSKKLEEAVLPQKKDIEEALRALSEY